MLLLAISSVLWVWFIRLEHAYYMLVFVLDDECMCVCVCVLLQGFEVLGLQVVYPTLTACKAAGVCYVPTVLESGLPVLVLCLSGKPGATVSTWARICSGVSILTLARLV